MNRYLLFALSTAAAASFVTVPAASQQIVVSPESSRALAESVSAGLDRQLRQTRYDPRVDDYGIAKVRFRAGVDGKATDVTTHEESGRPSLDRMARRAVSRLSGIHPGNYGVGNGQIFQANIVMARSEAHMAKLMKDLARDEARRIASAPTERTVLAVSNLSRPIP